MDYNSKLTLSVHRKFEHVFMGAWNWERRVILNKILLKIFEYHKCSKGIIRVNLSNNYSQNLNAANKGKSIKDSIRLGALL